jgi:energy-converting hydrogenase Eha subunit G
MNVEEHKIRQLVVVGTKLVLVGGIIFAIGAIVYMNSPNLGFEEQSLLSLVIMVSFIVWVVGAIYFGVAGDQWLILRTEYRSKQK